MIRILSRGVPNITLHRASSVQLFIVQPLHAALGSHISKIEVNNAFQFKVIVFLVYPELTEAFAARAPLCCLVTRTHTITIAITSDVSVCRPLWSPYLSGLIYRHVRSESEPLGLSHDLSCLPSRHTS